MPLLIKRYVCGISDLQQVNPTTLCKFNQTGCTTSKLKISLFRCLAKFVLPSHVGEPSALSVSYNLSTVMVGCSDGNLVRYQLTSEQIEKFKSISEQHEEEKITAIRPTTIYPSGSEWHEGYIDDMHVLGQDNIKENPLYNYVGKTR